MAAHAIRIGLGILPAKPYGKTDRTDPNCRAITNRTSWRWQLRITSRMQSSSFVRLFRGELAGLHSHCKGSSLTSASGAISSDFQPSDKNTEATFLLQLAL
jgi:hypothetical protein